MINRLIDT